MASQLLGVLLRASRDTTQVMLGVSLRARLGTTIVIVIYRQVQAVAPCSIQFRCRQSVIQFRGLYSSIVFSGQSRSINIYNCVLKPHYTILKSSARAPRTVTKFAVKTAIDLTASAVFLGNFFDRRLRAELTSATSVTVHSVGGASGFRSVTKCVPRKKDAQRARANSSYHAYR